MEHFGEGDAGGGANMGGGAIGGGGKEKWRSCVEALCATKHDEDK